MQISNTFKIRRAEALFEEAISLSPEEDERAISVYKRLLSLNEFHQAGLYNLGLIYKYRGQWRESLHVNQRAYQLDSNQEAVRWNMASAATALRRWDIARQAWLDQGIEMDDEGPVQMNLGMTPVRLNPQTGGEVVWGLRIDPVRVRIINIPFKETGFLHGDVVLHDGAAVGFRSKGDVNYPVFNVLERFEASNLKTFNCKVLVQDEESILIFLNMLCEMGCYMEDWTKNVRFICRHCQGERVDDPLPRHINTGTWSKRFLGIAAPDLHTISGVLNRWQDLTCSQVVSIT
jgi:hypothetical protein